MEIQVRLVNYQVNRRYEQANRWRAVICGLRPVRPFKSTRTEALIIYFAHMAQKLGLVFFSPVLTFYNNNNNSHIATNSRTRRSALVVCVGGDSSSGRWKLNRARRKNESWGRDFWEWRAAGRVIRFRFFLLLLFSSTTNQVQIFNDRPKCIHTMMLTQRFSIYAFVCSSIESCNAWQQEKK